MKLLCLLKPCKFKWMFDVSNIYNQAFGIYQCTRCKAITIGDRHVSKPYEYKETTQ